jgi:hypothetical protein
MGGPLLRKTTGVTLVPACAYFDRMVRMEFSLVADYAKANSLCFNGSNRAFYLAACPSFGPELPQRRN